MIVGPRFLAACRGNLDHNLNLKKKYDAWEPDGHGAKLTHSAANRRPNVASLVANMRPNAAFHVAICGH